MLNGTVWTQSGLSLTSCLIKLLKLLLKWRKAFSHKITTHSLWTIYNKVNVSTQINRKVNDIITSLTWLGVNREQRPSAVNRSSADRVVEDISCTPTGCLLARQAGREKQLPYFVTVTWSCNSRCLGNGPRDRTVELVRGARHAASFRQEDRRRRR